jgi:hypothetical protein
VYFLFLFTLSLHLAEALDSAVEASSLAGSSTSDIEGGGGEAIAMRGASRVTVIDVPPWDSPASCGATGAP